VTEKILITARSFRATPGPHLDLLRGARYELVESPHDRPLDAPEIAPLLRDAVGAILGLDRVDAAALEGAERLRVLSRYGVGTDALDIPAASRCGVAVTITPSVNNVAVAELALGLMLALARRIPQHSATIKAGAWKRSPGTELSGATLGILGIGQIGRDVAVRAAAFGMKILYWDLVHPPAEFVARVGAQSRSFEDLLAESDVVSLHLPLTDGTRNLLDAAALARMKPTALLINTARGGIVDEAALYAALQAGRLGGAAFDVFLKEPCGENPLLTLDNFIASPHAGSATLQTTLRMGRLASENLLMVLRGERCPHTVNPEVYG